MGVCEGLPVFEFAIVSEVFLIISVKVFVMHFIMVLYMFCETAVGKCWRMPIVRFRFVL